MIINSLLDNDLYKFTMLQAFLHYEEHTSAKYEFFCRTKDIDLTCIYEDFKKEVEHLCSLSFKEDELDYLSSLPYIKQPFIDFLRGFKLHSSMVSHSITQKGQLSITLTGPIVQISMFEVPLLSIISELYSRSRIKPEAAFEEGSRRLEKKIDFIETQLNHIAFIDFGSRRRYSHDWHDHVVSAIAKSGIRGFVGTSNVYMARKYSVMPAGTMAHEWIMAHAGVTDFRKSNKLALKRWLEFYNGTLGIALTDTYTTDSFLSDFDKELSKKYEGLRHDSGDWRVWGEKVLQHYEMLGINPSNKKLIYSDSLNFELISQIDAEFKDKANILYGIGTNLTNDVGLNALQIVIKMVECNGKPVIKISDDEGKIMCKDEGFKRKALEYFSKAKNL